jgi:NSS family neurotransmitter:Na+ symporter
MIKGISRGIENLNKIGILLLVALLVPLAIYGMSLPGSEKGLEYYLTPDFSKLSEPSIWSTAFGQVFFSLSLGSGILLTYGSYLKGGLSLLKSSSIIIVSNAMVSFVAGLMIFSFIFSFGTQPEGGIALVFEILPTVFGSMEYGMIIGIVFFFLLLIAGLTSSVSLFQVQVSSFEDTLRFSKRKSVTIVTLLVAVVGTLSALSYSSFEFQLFETPFLDLMDTYFGTFGLSIASVVLITIVTWYMDKKKIIEQFNQNSRIKFPPVLIEITKYVLPGIVVISILFTVFNL